MAQVPIKRAVVPDILIIADDLSGAADCGITFAAVIRTSVDHGTAFDIAGKGIADERSMLEALRQAIDLAPKRDDGQASERAA